MIIVTGSVTARPETFEALKAEGLAHSERSRAEDGCVSHRCYLDAADSLRLFFYEQWRDRAALDAHFRHPDTPRILAAIREMAAASEGPVLLEVTPAVR